MTPEELSERLLEFGARVGRLVDALPDSGLRRHVASQVVRCGTSPGPNYEEGCAAESRNDFVHKLSIVLKELRESHYWMRLIVKSGLLPETRMSPLINECTELSKILAQSLITAKQNAHKHP